MSTKKNCWEYMKCGREKAGRNVALLGVCPVAMPNDYDGVNDGSQAGRFCWTVSDSYCIETKNEIKSNVERLHNCMECLFFRIVEEEQGKEFAFTPSKVNISTKTEV